MDHTNIRQKGRTTKSAGLRGKGQPIWHGRTIFQSRLIIKNVSAIHIMENVVRKLKNKRLVSDRMLIRHRIGNGGRIIDGRNANGCSNRLPPQPPIVTAGRSLHVKRTLFGGVDRGGKLKPSMAFIKGDKITLVDLGDTIIFVKGTTMNILNFKMGDLHAVIHMSADHQTFFGLNILMRAGVGDGWGIHHRKDRCTNRIGGCGNGTGSPWQRGV